MKSKTNLELKHYCSDFKKVRTILKQVGAKKYVIKKQKDYFFELPIVEKFILSRLKLRVEGKNKTLIYYERSDFVKGKANTSDVLLYSVGDTQLLPFLKKALGIKTIVEKKREVWRKNNVIFHLDNVKNIGNIFEIELQKKGRITEKDKRLFILYKNEFLPFLGDLIKGSNCDLVSSEKVIF